MSQEVHAPITALTVTRGRPFLLKKCIESVRRQDYRGKVIHLILVDECAATIQFLQERYQFTPNFAWFEIARSENERSGPELLADRRNRLTAWAWTDWVSLLDDDDQYEPSHLRLLYEAAQKEQADAAYSHIKVFYRNDSPFLEEQWPWCRTQALGKEKYADLLQKGIVSKGSNEIKECAIEGFHYRVITGAWLLKRRLMAENPMPSDFSYREFVENKAEDDKLLDNVIRSGATLVQSEAFTLRYYVGGYSNEPGLQKQDAQKWEWVTPVDGPTDRPSPPNALPLLETDLAFYINVFEDLSLLEVCLAQLRKVYPYAQLIIRSDGDPNPAFKKITEAYHGIFFYGENLMPIRHGGKIVHEMLRHFLEATNSKYLFKIDPDTRVFKKFKKLPDYSAIFGTVQHQETLFSIQGGCIGFTRDVAKHLYETRYFLHPDFARERPPWCINQTLLNRPLYKGLTSFDWLIGWACRECRIRMIDWPEIYSQWLPPVPEGIEEKFAIAHPFKG